MTMTNYSQSVSAYESICDSTVCDQSIIFELLYA